MALSLNTQPPRSRPQPHHLGIWREDEQLWAVWSTKTQRGWWHHRLPQPVEALPYEALQDLPLWVIDALWDFVLHETLMTLSPYESHE